MRAAWREELSPGAFLERAGQVNGQRVAVVDGGLRFSYAAPPGLDQLPPAEQARFKARQGFPHLLAGRQRVVDEEMRDVPSDGVAMGEAVLKGNVVMMGFYREPAASLEAFRGRWFHTGDIGVIHADGQLDLRDRKKDIIICGGENISTIEVEQAVAAHPAVLECAVIAVPDDRWVRCPWRSRP